MERSRLRQEAEKGILRRSGTHWHQQRLGVGEGKGCSIDRARHLKGWQVRREHTLVTASWRSGSGNGWEGRGGQAGSRGGRCERCMQLIANSDLFSEHEAVRLLDDLVGGARRRQRSVPQVGGITGAQRRARLLSGCGLRGILRAAAAAAAGTTKDRTRVELLPAAERAPQLCRPSTLQTPCPLPTPAAASSMVMTTGCSTGDDAVVSLLNPARPKGERLAPVATMNLSPGCPSHLTSSSARFPAGGRVRWAKGGGEGREDAGSAIPMVNSGVHLILHTEQMDTAAVKVRHS